MLTGGVHFRPVCQQEGYQQRIEGTCDAGYFNAYICAEL